MARAKKENNNSDNTEKYGFDYYMKPDNWEQAEEVLSSCFRKIDVLAQLKISETVLDKLIIAKGFNNFTEIRDHYRNNLVSQIGIQFVKKIKSGLASEKFLTFAIEKIYIPALEKFEEDQRKATDGGVVVEKPIFDFLDGNNITLELIALQQQQAVQDALDRERQEEEKNEK